MCLIKDSDTVFKQDGLSKTNPETNLAAFR